MSDSRHLEMDTPVHSKIVGGKNTEIGPNSTRVYDAGTES